MINNLKVNIPTDQEGMFGRECPNCKKYFKVKYGTGLADISKCTCPYCEFTEESSAFLTSSQLDYIKSYIAKQILGTALHDLERSFKDIERSTQHSIISLKFKTHGFSIPIKYYSEKDLETVVVCDHCGLVFSIFGIFATCPDCAHLTAMSMFQKSIEAVRKRFIIVDRIPEDEKENQDALLIDILSALVAAFDGLGKRLSKQYPMLIPEKPRNLFQNLDYLEEILKKNSSIDLPKLLNNGQYQKLYYFFQVRHIWNHNFGEADADFIRKTGSDSNLLGTRVIPNREEVAEFCSLVECLGVNLRNELQVHG